MNCESTAQVVDTSASGNWNPSSIFDRINGDTSLEIGEIAMYPRIGNFKSKSSKLI